MVHLIEDRVTWENYTLIQGVSPDKEIKGIVPGVLFLIQKEKEEKDDAKLPTFPHF